MKMNSNTKNKMKKQREQRIKNVYNNFHKGNDVSFLYKSNDLTYYTRYLELKSKREHEGKYYFICRILPTDVIVVLKLVYSGRVAILYSKRDHEKNIDLYDKWMWEVYNKKRYKL